MFKNIIEYLPLSNVTRRFIFLHLFDPQWVSPSLGNFIHILKGCTIWEHKSVAKNAAVAEENFSVLSLRMMFLLIWKIETFTFGVGGVTSMLWAFFCCLIAYSLTRLIWMSNPLRVAPIHLLPHHFLWQCSSEFATELDNAAEQPK